MADIVIRGMEMPKDRSLWLLIRPDGTVFKIKDNDKLGLPKEGAAIFLPEGHGRLIDADDLIDEMALAWEYDQITNAEWTGIREWLNHAPTIVPAEGGTDDV